MKKLNLVWNVYKRNFNNQEIEVFNVFDHYRLLEDIKKLRKKKLSKEEFSEQLRREFMYYYWSKFEYEVVVTTFPPYITDKELSRINDERLENFQKNGRYRGSYHVSPETGIKIDIYDQVCLNWDKLIDYVWGEVNK